MTLNEAFAQHLRDTARQLDFVASKLESGEISGETALASVDRERQALSERSQLFADRMAAEGAEGVTS